MRIALVDGDLDSSFKNLLNIDLMKIYTYYRKKGDIISLLSKNDEISKFSKVFYYKDFNIEMMPTSLLEISGLEVGGEAFGIHLPEEIERQIPTKTFYTPVFEKYLKINKNSRRITERIKFLSTCDDVRIYYNGKVCPNFDKGIEKRSYSLGIHDVNIFQYDDWYEILKDITKRPGTKITRSLSFKFPININNLDLYKKLREFSLKDRFYNISMPIDCDDELCEFCSASISRESQKNYVFNLFLEKESYSEDEIIPILLKILPRVFFFRSRRNNFTLYYEPGTLIKPFDIFLESLTVWYNRCKREKILNGVRFNDFVSFLPVTSQEIINTLYNKYPQIKDIVKSERYYYD